MPLDLTSVRAKLTRSQEHTQAFKNEVLAWTERHPYSLLQKKNSDCTRHSLIIRVNEPPPLQRWSLMIADAFNNLRSALDHLVYAIAVHEAAPNVPARERKLQFPITDCGVRFDSAVNERHNLGAITEPVRAAIKNAQPYNRPDPTLPPLLAILRDFTNSDKHKLLHLALTCPIRGDIGFSGSLPPGAGCEVSPFMGEIEDEAEVCAIVSSCPTPEMKFDRHVLDVVVAIRHAKRDPLGPDWTGRTEFAALYREISSVVRGVIYEVVAKVR